MPGTPLYIKFSIPPVSSATLSRPFLLKSLDQGQAGKLTLISAPAGFGKTSLLADWANSCSAPPVWISLDENDNDPIRFFSNILAAFQMIDPNLASELAQDLQSPRPLSLEELLTDLIDQVAAQPGQQVLILDDFHLIYAYPILNALSILLDKLPANLHLFISTRVDPPLQLSRLRSKRQLLVELHSADLRFNLEETRLFMEHALHQQLNQADIEALSKRTAGWVIALQMAALALRDCQEIPNLIQDFISSNRFILNYFLEMLLKHQPTQVQSFLLQTSVLERLNGALCDAVTGQSGNQQTLLQLEQEGLFTSALDEKRSWFKYHPLFADQLQRRQRQVCPEDGFTTYKRASHWYEQNGFIPAAIENAFKAQDISMAARLVEIHAKSFWNSGQQASLYKWLQALSDEVVRSRPRLAIYRSIQLYSSGLQLAAQEYLRIAESGLLGLDVDLIQEERDILNEARAIIRK